MRKPELAPPPSVSPPKTVVVPGVPRAPMTGAPAGGGTAGFGAAVTSTGVGLPRSDHSRYSPRTQTRLPGQQPQPVSQPPQSTWQGPQPFPLLPNQLSHTFHNPPCGGGCCVTMVPLPSSPNGALPNGGLPTTTGG